MYADGKAIYCISKSTTDIVKKLNITANDLCAWCRKNHFTVHVCKTEAMILSTAKFVGPLKLVMSGSEMISYATENISLGVKIGSGLNQKGHLLKKQKFLVVNLKR